MLTSLLSTNEIRAMAFYAEGLGLQNMRLTAMRDVDTCAGFTIVAQLGNDRATARFSFTQMRWHTEPVLPLMAWIKSLEPRFRASYARPAEPWPDCLPPMFGPAIELPAPSPPLPGAGILVHDGEGLPPMFPSITPPEPS